MSVDRGRVFREAWIAGVKRHYPGEPKASYIAPWEETPDWERSSVTAVFDQVLSFMDETAGAASKLTRDQKSRFISLCWVGQVFHHFPDPKPSYVADWEALPQWQQDTNADIFEAIGQEWRNRREEGHG